MSVPPSPPMRLTSRLLIPLAALLFAGGVWALSTDKRQDIEIEADAAELDDLKGIVVYRGNVIVKQGSLRMTGDTMTVTFNEQDDMDTVIMRAIRQRIANCRTAAKFMIKPRPCRWSIMPAKIM